MQGGKDSQAPLRLPHPDISGCAVFILSPCKGLPAAVTSPSNTPASYEGRIPISSAGARVLSRILARGRVRLGGGRVVAVVQRGSWAPTVPGGAGHSHNPGDLSEG